MSDDFVISRPNDELRPKTSASGSSDRSSTSSSQNRRIIKALKGLSKDEVKKIANALEEIAEEKTLSKSVFGDDELLGSSRSGPTSSSVSSVSSTSVSSTSEEDTSTSESETSTSESYDEDEGRWIKRSNKKVSDEDDDEYDEFTSSSSSEDWYPQKPSWKQKILGWLGIRSNTDYDDESSSED